MSKKCQKEIENVSNGVDCHLSENINKNDQKSMLSSVIGTSNVKLWMHLRTAFSCNNNEEFVKALLDIANEHLDRNKINKSENTENHINEESSKRYARLRRDQRLRKDARKNVLKADNSDENREQKSVVPLESDLDVSNNASEDLASSEAVKNSLILNDTNKLYVPLNDKTGISVKEELPEVSSKPEQVLEKVKKAKSEKKAKKQEHDIRKAPELLLQTSEVKEQKEEKVQDANQRLAIKIKLCGGCNTRHLQDQCPLGIPKYVIEDLLKHEEWLEQFIELYGKNASIEDGKTELESSTINKFSFAYQSLPMNLYFEETNTVHGLGVFAKNEIYDFTQFGPLLGKTVKEVDIPEECNMRDIFEINNGDSPTYINTENVEEANWMRFVRPSPTRELRNVTLISKDDSLYLVTVKRITVGEELLYWQDDVSSSNKKKMEKTSCGGCNMTFLHPLYYRIHCSVFHDVRYSLTIRKYHCKVCGVAVLGKENIMKHAIELHNGQGAYQCQFCKKFFLRLNYLEMHRTYGCSANPHRSRPLCDFCGRKFCQPQKLKVHIKRMHSDMSEVLKEFQCKNCLKLLGSRAALQRHLKEVHQKQVEGACACNKCGKMFQNKSNLKIHMLTHSGIKPFKCAEGNCIAAFTTKQCLQFHYKKVHGFTEEVMPKIERSVDYTFEAYSGTDDQEMMDKQSDDKNDMNDSDQEDNNLELDDRNIDEPPDLHSPLPIQTNDHSSNSDESPPTLEAYAPSMKIISKGSKKWIIEEPLVRNDIYPMESRKDEVNLDVEEADAYDTRKLNTNLNTFRHESNASLLVEAALDSVCSEPNIDIDVSTTPNCTDALVNNLYTLSHGDTLPEVTYNHSVDVNDSRDINLISPSVNDHISVTDDLNDELRHTQTIGIDYSSLQEDFSPPTSPSRNNFVRNYINENSPTNPNNYENQSKNISPQVSPPRYDFGQTVNAESDDSSGIGAQNLSLHNTKDGIQLDLSIYKSHYNFDTSSFLRKSTRLKFDENDRKQSYILDVDKSYNDDTNKFSMNGNISTNQDNLENELSDKDFENIQDVKHKDNDLDLSIRSTLPDIRNKFEIDLDLRKSYDIDAEIRRNTYEGSLDDFRMKNYDLDNLELRNNLERNKTYESIMEDFRTDRNFEPLVLNPSELQGLDMSARSYHNYSNLNRYHHLYPEVDRPTVDLRMNYSPPPPTYSHADILRVVSLDLTPPGRHSVDLSLRTHQIANSRLLSDHTLQAAPHRLSLDQSRLMSTDLGAPRHLGTDSRLISDMSNRILSDHTTNRILSNDQLSTNRLLGTEQRLLTDDSRLISDQPRLLDQSRLLSDGRILPAAPTTGNMSPVAYSGYPVSPTHPYHPTALPPRPHATSPSSTPYHHYPTYY